MNQFDDPALLILSIDPLIMLIMAAASFLMMVIAIWLASPWLAAFVGHYRLRHWLQHFEKLGCTVINNVSLPDRRGGTVHTDHLVITNQSIIAIERVGYGGDIFGSLREGRWVQESKKGMHRFPNPLRNHEPLRETLQGILGTKLRIHPMTVFTAGNLHVAESDSVMTSKQFERFAERLAQEKPSGPKQVWASNLLRNMAIVDNEVEETLLSSFNKRQGNPKHLKSATWLLGGSAMTMLAAMIMAGGRMLAGIGLI